MELGDITDVGVVGAGTMGAGIAQVFAQAGYAVRWYNRSAAGLQRGLSRIRDNQSLLIRHGVLTAGQAEVALARLYPTEALADLAGVQLVSESIAEDLPAKQALFKALDRLCGGATIFTTNTSGLSISRIAEAVSQPGRFAGLHYANPPHIIPIVEIITGEETSAATCEVLTALARRLGKRPVLVRHEVPGFIANRLQFALMREALHLIEAGVASVADVDAAIKHGIGLRWALFGPLEIADLGGLDVFDAIAGYLFQDLNSAAEVPSVLHRRVAEGRLGVKSGSGFYTYTPEQGQALAARRDEGLLALLRVRQQAEGTAPMSGIWPEAAGDVAAIRRLHAEAFGRPDEANLVDALRTAGALRIGLVAVEDGTVVGHIAFSPVAVRDGTSTLNALGLAPMAVLPGWQRRGIGSRLVRAGLAACGETPYGLVFVLGAPQFYGRFGFKPAKPLGINWEHAGPSDAFMVQALKRGALRGIRGVVAYRPEFDGL